MTTEELIACLRNEPYGLRTAAADTIERLTAKIESMKLDKEADWRESVREREAALKARNAEIEHLAEALESIPCPECAEGQTFHGGYAGAAAKCPYCGGTGEHPRARAALADYREGK